MCIRDRNIPKGTKDVLPADAYRWQYVEGVARETAKLYNLKEIRTPVFEHTELFLRGVGDTTDIVTKEMYTSVSYTHLEIRQKNFCLAVRSRYGRGDGLQCPHKKRRLPHRKFV